MNRLISSDGLCIQQESMIKITHLCLCLHTRKSRPRFISSLYCFPVSFSFEIAKKNRFVWHRYVLSTSPTWAASTCCLYLRLTLACCELQVIVSLFEWRMETVYVSFVATVISLWSYCLHHRIQAQHSTLVGMRQTNVLVPRTLYRPRQRFAKSAKIAIEYFIISSPRGSTAHFCNCSKSLTYPPPP